MNYAHLHLMLNHIPVIGTGIVVLLLIIAIFRKSRELLAVSMIVMVLVALATIPAYLTGEPAEELVEDSPGVSEQLIEQHEDMAEKAFIFVEVTGGLALITLLGLRYNERYGKRLAVLTLMTLIISSGTIAWTANLGGQIRHNEIRSDTGSLSLPYPRTNNKEDDD